MKKGLKKVKRFLRDDKEDILLFLFVGLPTGVIMFWLSKYFNLLCY